MSKILVVDDSAIIYRIIKRIVESNGHEVIGHALNGLECLEMMSKYEPDIITLDLAMPVMDGFVTSKKISEKFPSFISKIIILSSMGDEGLIKEVNSIGIQNVLCKPVNDADLLEMIEKVLKINKPGAIV